MIYKVFLDGISIYDTSEELSLIKGTADQELNGAGSCEITIPYNHKYYDYPVKPMLTIVDIYENDTIIFTGRVTDIKTNWNREKTFSVEGALAYFNDSILRPDSTSWQDVQLKTFFTGLITKHNELVASYPEKQFVVGEVTVTGWSQNVTRSVDYVKTYDVIQEQCINTNGGYIYVEKKKIDEEYKNVINWVAEMPNTSTQPIQFAKNLLDINTDISGTDVITAVIPLGKDSNGDRVTIDSVHGSDEIVTDDSALLSQFGKLVEVVDFDDVASPMVLLEQGNQYLAAKNVDRLVIEADVAELAYLDPDMDVFNVGQKVHVKSVPHGIDADLTISKISYDLMKASKKITIGTLEKQDLSEITGSEASGSSSGSSGGGGGGGGGGGSVVTVRPNPEMEDGDEIAVITVNANAYTLKYDASSKADKDTTYTKAEVNTLLDDKADADSVYTKLETYNRTEIDGHLALKANADDVYEKSETYNQTEVDAALALKADAADVYDKDEVYSKSETYNKDEVDAALATKPDASTFYTKTAMDEILEENYYTKPYLYTKTEIDEKENVLNGKIDEAKYRASNYHNNNRFTVKSNSPNTYTKKKLLDIDFQMNYVSPLMFDFTVQMDVTADSYSIIDGKYKIFGDTYVKVTYYIDNQERDEHIERVVLDGPNELTLHYSLSAIDALVSHNFQIHLSVMNGQIDVAKYGTFGSISGTGFDDSGFSGVAVGEDNIVPFNFEGTFANFTETSSIEEVPVDNKPISEYVGPLNFTSIFKGFSESFEIEEGAPEND